jgi:hypothetical protein
MLGRLIVFAVWAYLVFAYGIYGIGVVVVCCALWLFWKQAHD